MPGDDKAVVRTVGVLVLTLLAAIALRGYLPGAPPPAGPAPPTTTAAGSFVAVVVMLAVSLTAIAVSLVARGRSPRPPRQPASHLAPRGGERRAVPWRLLLIAAAVLLAWLLLITLLMRWVSPVDVGTAPAGSDRPARSGHRPNPNPTPPNRIRAAGPTCSGCSWTAIALFAALVGRHHRRPPAPHRDRTDARDDAPPAVPPPPDPISPGPPNSDWPRSATAAAIRARRSSPATRAMERELEKSPGIVPAGVGHPLGGAGPRRRPPRPARRQRDATGRPVRGGAVQPARDDRGTPRRGRADAASRSSSANCRASHDETGGRRPCLVVAARGVAIVLLDRELVVVVTGAALVVVLARGAVAPDPAHRARRRRPSPTTPEHRCAAGCLAPRH